MRLVLLLLVSFLASGCLARHAWPTLVERAKTDAPAILISDVSVFDGVSGTLAEHVDVVLRLDRVTQVRPHAELKCEDCAIIDGTGKTLMPGLIDAHVHLTGSPAPPWHVTWPDEDHNGAALLYSGVTTAMDVGGEREALSSLSARSKAGTWLGPDFTHAGMVLTPRGGYPASMVRELFPWPVSALAEDKFAHQLSTPEDAAKAVDANLGAGASYIKVAVAQVPLEAPVYTAELLAAVVTAAKARGVKVVAHVDTAEHALMAARAGVSVLVHGVHLGALTEAQAAELKTLGTVVIPTLVVWDRIDQLSQHRYAPTALERELYPADFLAYFAPEQTRQRTLPDGLMRWMQKLAADKPDRVLAVKRLSEAKVPLLVGADDAGSIGCMTGAAFHEEMRLLVEAGVPLLDVLRGATSEAGRVFGRDVGQVREGARADLLLLEGNPLVSLEAFSHIRTVIKGGKVIERKPPAK
ncbi:MAG: amidohydrolase family protein [Myxococcales bacterium]|nr:amidohydrolase family protein [Myxococcales bacterium]